MDCVKVICNKYELNKGDVVNMLMENGVKLKTTIKHFPWDGTVKDGCCEGLKYCGGLFIQCKQKIKENEQFCSFCYKQSQQNEHGKPSAGTIKDRLEVDALEYVDPKGRKVVPFSRYMKKKNIDREMAEIEAKMNNIEINEAQFIEVVVRRGRPKKTEVSNKNKTDRPKKEQHVVKAEDEVEDVTDINEGTRDEPDNMTDDETTDEHETNEDEEENNEDEEENNDDSSENIEVEVKEFEYCGKTYFKSDMGQVFDEEWKEIGTWDDTNETIDFN
tara:strand:+ start:461 stop:1282 length:822 start_codon:yes stop_codon:yes gene_type:complete